MSSTYSNLKIQLMTTGENSATWGNITNTNLGTAIEEAITGSADVVFSSANVTLTLTDTNSSQTARNLRLNLTGTTGGARNLIVPSIEKAYIINNGCADAVTVKNATGTGIAVPAGKTTWVFNDGINVVDVITSLISPTISGATISGGTISGLTSPLPAASGGTGVNTSTAANGTLLIGNGTGFTLSTLTAGSNITITNTAGGISIASATTGGTVTSVGGTGTVNGLTLTGTVTSSGNLTLGGDITSVNASATVNGFTIGYRQIPRSTTSGTATTGDVGKVIAVTAGITIPNSTFAAGDAISIYNNSASSITITQGSGLTMYQVGTATTGNRTLAQRGMATIWFNSATDCVISGGGLA